VDDIHHGAKRIGEEFLETGNSIIALKKSRQLRMGLSNYKKERIELQNAIMASFINPQLHIVKQSHIHIIVEKLSLTHADDWMTHAVLALYSTQEKGSYPFNRLLTISAKDAIKESSELQHACSCNLHSTCLFMIIFIIEEIALKEKNTNSDTISSLVHAAGEWLMMLSDSIITFSESAMKKNISKSSSINGYEKVLFTNSDIWMAESLFSLYAVISRQLKTDHYHPPMPTL
jgi:hypothetical protein